MKPSVLSPHRTTPDAPRVRIAVGRAGSALLMALPLIAAPAVVAAQAPAGESTPGLAARLAGLASGVDEGRLAFAAVVVLLAIGGVFAHRWYYSEKNVERRRARNLPFVVFDAGDDEVQQRNREASAILPIVVAQNGAAAARDALIPIDSAPAVQAGGLGPAPEAVGGGPVPTPAFDGTLQLLPGRLEPLHDNGGQEVRFIKMPGLCRFTFGRSQGPAHTHIRLRAPTASRMHAFMVFERGRWRIGNLSATNPVVVNGAPLPTAEHVTWLEDGDRIELGEMTFVFRER